MNEPNATPPATPLVAPLATERYTGYAPWISRLGIMHPGAPRLANGYFLRDERASGGVLEEWPAATCAHCGVVVLLNPARVRERGHCRKCNAYICDKPVCHAECNPIEQMVELGLRYPDQPWLARGPQGETSFDPRLLARHRLYLGK